MRRRTIAGVGAALLVLGASAGLAPVRAESDFNNGTASADAEVVKVTPGVGNLGLSTQGGVSIAQLQDRIAQAQSATLDLGLIGGTLTAPGCSGSPGALKPEQLPQSTRADNRKGTASAALDQVPVSGSQLSGGHQTAAATAKPSAEASVSAGLLEFSPLVKLEGGKSTAAAGVADGPKGKYRQASSTVSLNITLGNAVTLTGLQWQAIHHTATDPKDTQATGTFSIVGASVAGAPVPIGDSLKPVQDAVNTALAFTGMRIELPTVQHITTPNDLIKVTPLRIIIQDSQLGATLFRPGLDLVRPQKEQLFTQIGSSLCQTAGAILVGDIGLSIAAGAGFLAIDVGGAQAASANVKFENPFGTDEPLPSLEIPGAPSVAADTFLPPVQTGSALAAPQTVAKAGPVEKVCESTHKFHWPRCSHGAALPLGIAGVLATAGVAALDWRHQRRKLRQAQVHA